MRTTAMILNLCLVSLTVLYGLQEGFGVEGLGVVLLALIILAPLVSLLALFLQGPASKDWLARYCERKALEERQKLDRLRPPPA